MSRVPLVAIAAVVVLAPAPLGADPIFSFDPISPPNQPVGTTILFAVTTPAEGPPLKFRYSVAARGLPFMIAREFAARQAFDWTPLEEGLYDVKVTVRDPATGETGESIVPYQVTSRVTGGEAIVTTLPHPLVALYSAPSCSSGLLRVRFRALPAGAWQYTPWKPCIQGRSVNLYVAGMIADTDHELQHEVLTVFGLGRGRPLPFRTGAINTTIFAVDVQQSGGPISGEGILLTSVPFGGFAFPLPIATDLSGRILWFYDRLTSIVTFGSYLMRPLPGGNMLLAVKDGPVGQVLREIDLAGNTVRETNVAAVREQLDARGLIDSSTHYIGAFHHDAVRLPNGHTLALVSVEHLVDAVDYLGDAVVELDENLQVTWAWNAFDHMPLRQPPLGEECTSPLDGCPPLFLGERVTDWTHTNTISPLPDGNLVLSMRNQDAILKIDYRNGFGSGRIIWEFGPNGDFTLDTTDPDPWFSHQHDVKLEGNRLLLYDNGNGREEANPPALSRGQVFRLHEATRRATLELNATLSVYAAAFGSTQRLANGNYHFLSGFLTGPASQSIEVSPTGITSYDAPITINLNAAAYRSWRMWSLYVP